MLGFGDKDVDCERDDEIVVFVKVGNVVDESDCGDVEKLVVDEDVGIDVIGEVGAVGGRFGRGISKISTTLEYPLFVYWPPPKNILFLDDVDASSERGWERFVVTKCYLSHSTYQQLMRVLNHSNLLQMQQSL
jgi:hypothetical protein